MLLLNPEQILTIAGEEFLSWSTWPLIRLGHWLEFRSPHKTADSLPPIMNAPTVLMLALGNERVGYK